QWLRGVRQGGFGDGRGHQDREDADRPRRPLSAPCAALAGRHRVDDAGEREVVRALFASDLHLSEDRPEANERLIAFLEGKARSADALYLLGDLFEYWIGDDGLDESFNAVIAGFLRELTRRGVRLCVMHGNRDFLIGEAATPCRSTRGAASAGCCPTGTGAAATWKSPPASRGWSASKQVRLRAAGRA